VHGLHQIPIAVNTARCEHQRGVNLASGSVLQSPQAGEIASFIADEGQPVEYGEDVVELAPFFGGAHIDGSHTSVPTCRSFTGSEVGFTRVCLKGVECTMSQPKLSGV